MTNTLIYFKSITQSKQGTLQKSKHCVQLLLCKTVGCIRSCSASFVFGWVGYFPWKEERGPSSIRRTLELLQMQHWGNFRERRNTAHMCFSERIDTVLNWTELNWVFSFEGGILIMMTLSNQQRKFRHSARDHCRNLRHFTKDASIVISITWHVNKYKVGSSSKVAS